MSISYEELVKLTPESIDDILHPLIKEASDRMLLNFFGILQGRGVIDSICSEEELIDATHDLRISFIDMFEYDYGYHPSIYTSYRRMVEFSMVSTTYNVEDVVDSLFRYPYTKLAEVNVMLSCLAANQQRKPVTYFSDIFSSMIRTNQEIVSDYLLGFTLGMCISISHMGWLDEAYIKEVVDKLVNMLSADDLNPYAKCEVVLAVLLGRENLDDLPVEKCLDLLEIGSYRTCYGRSMYRELIKQADLTEHYITTNLMYELVTNGTRSNKLGKVVCPNFVERMINTR